MKLKSGTKGHSVVAGVLLWFCLMAHPELLFIMRNNLLWTYSVDAELLLELYLIQFKWAYRHISVPLSTHVSWFTVTDLY